MNRRPRRDWRDPINENVLLYDNEAARRLVSQLEEVVLDDSTATPDYTRVDVARHGRDASLPPGVMLVRVRYDGSRDVALVAAVLQAMRSSAVSPGEAVVHRIEAHARLGSNDGGWAEQQRRRREYAGSVRSGGRRRGESAEQPAPEPPQEEFRIDWDSVEKWATPDQEWLITEMPDPLLWHTICWVVRNQIELFQSYAIITTSATPALAAAWWLRDQSAFRALLKESIRRCFTLPDDVFTYCKKYVLDRSHSLDGYQPWRDASRSEQPRQLEPFLKEPTVSPINHFNKDLRSIEL